MKYNEAIDMILDGGEAYHELYPDERIKFDKDTDILIMVDEKGEIHDHFCFDKNDFTKTGWIVEKDGVVYEEYPEPIKDLLYAPTINLYDRIGLGDCVLCGQFQKHLYRSVVDKRELFCKECVLGGGATARVFNLIRNGDLVVYVKSRIHEQEEPAELEEASEPWEQIKMPIIADEVNEDWIEKKMLCFLRKRGLFPNNIKTSDCMNKDCPFCFPRQEVEKNCQDSSEAIKKFIKDMEPPITPKEASEKTVKNIMDVVNNHLEKPREKVTVEEMNFLIKRFCSCVAYWENCGKNVELRRDRLKESLEIEKCIKQKLEYLVSLQEK